MLVLARFSMEYIVMSEKCRIVGSSKSSRPQLQSTVPPWKDDVVAVEVYHIDSAIVSVSGVNNNA